MLKDTIKTCGSYWYDIATDKTVCDDNNDYLFELGIIRYNDETMTDYYANKSMSIDIMQLEIVKHIDGITEFLKYAMDMEYLNGIQLEKARYIIDNADDIKTFYDDRIMFKDAMNNLGLPDLADIGALYTRKDYRRVHEAYETLTDLYGDTFLNTLTAETVRGLLK